MHTDLNDIQLNDNTDLWSCNMTVALCTTRYLARKTACDCNTRRTRKDTACESYHAKLRDVLLVPTRNVQT